MQDPASILPADMLEELRELLASAVRTGLRIDGETCGRFAEAIAACQEGVEGALRALDLLAEDAAAAEERAAAASVHVLRPLAQAQALTPDRRVILFPVRLPPRQAFHGFSDGGDAA